MKRAPSVLRPPAPSCILLHHVPEVRLPQVLLPPVHGKENADSAVISPFLHSSPSNPASLAPCRPLSSLVLLLLTP